MEPRNDADTGISLQEFQQIIRRRYMIILQSVVIVGVIVVVMNLLAQNVYQASARLLVQPPSGTLSTVDGTNPISDLLTQADPQPVSTTVQVLQSPTLFAKVTKETGVPGSGIKVEQVGDTNVIECTAEATSPGKAAAAANVLLTSYLQQDSDRSLATIKNAAEFASQQYDIASKELDQTEIALRDFKRKHSVSELTAVRIRLSQNIGVLEQSANDQEEKLASLHTLIQTQQGLLGTQPASLRSETQTTNPAITAIQARIADLRVQRQGMIGPGRYTAQAPQVKTFDDQIKLLERQLAATPALIASETVSPNPYVQSTKDRLTDLKAQETAQAEQLTKTRQDLAAARAAVGHFADWEVTLQRLGRAHDEAESQYLMFREKLADLSLRERAYQPNATILESAKPPASPIKPKRTFNIIIGCIFGLFIGVCLALLQDFLDDRINTSEEADRLLGLASLGHVPAISAEDAKLLPHMKGLDPAAESYRILRTNIHFASIDAPARTLLVTSANPGEGKTTTGANLAFAMAMDGKSVILVDADLRRPSLAKMLNLPSVPGLTDVLLGHSTLNETLQPMEYLPNLMILPGGSAPPNPGELLNSRTFRNLVEQLQDRANVVIFDSPPVLVAADAAILASQMDGTVIVIETGGTKRGAAQRMVHVLKQARANVLGIAYNKMKAQDGSYYYHYNYKYVTSDLPGSKNGSAPQLDSPRDAATPAEKRER